MGRIKILENNRGASLVLVSILSTLVIGMAAALLIVSSLIMSTSVRKTRENQAYELATSLSSQLEFLILNETEDGSHKSRIELTDGTTLVSETGFSSIPDSSVKAVVTYRRGNLLHLNRNRNRCGRNIYQNHRIFR